MKSKTESYEIVNGTEYKELSVPTPLLIQPDRQGFLLCKSSTQTKLTNSRFSASGLYLS